MGGPFVPLVRILIENGAVMFLGVLATLKHHFDQRVELSVCVIGVVHVCR